MDRGPQYSTGGRKQNHPKEKEKKPKRLSEEALQIEEQGEAKSKRERETYPIKCRVPKNTQQRQEGLLQ